MSFDPYVAVIRFGMGLSPHRATPARVEDLLAEVRKKFGPHNYPLFVRACPLNPRPGVLESSRADTTKLS